MHQPTIHQLTACAAGEDKSQNQLSKPHQGGHFRSSWCRTHCDGGCQHSRCSCTALMPACGAAPHPSEQRPALCHRLTLVAMLSASSMLPSMLSTSASMHSTQHVRPDRMQSALRSRGLPASRPLKHKLVDLPAICTDALWENELHGLVCALEEEIEAVCSCLASTVNH